MFTLILWWIPFPLEDRGEGAGRFSCLSPTQLDHFTYLLGQTSTKGPKFLDYGI